MTVNRTSSTHIAGHARAASQPVQIASTLQRGASGQEVRQLQASLNERGFALEADGRFGPATEAAVRRFQQGQGLNSDGIVGPATLARLQDTGRVAPADRMERGAGGQTGALPRAPIASAQPTPPDVQLRRGLAGAAANHAGLGLRQTDGGPVRIREDRTAVQLSAMSPAHARLVNDMRAQGFFPVRTTDGAHLFMSNPTYDADRTGRGVSSREAQAFAQEHGLRLPTRAEADAFRAQAPVLVQFETGPTPGTANARSGIEQNARIAARLEHAGIPTSGVAIAGATKIWALEPGRRPGLNGGVTNVNSGAALQGYSTVHGPDYEDYSQAAQFVHPVRVSPQGDILR